MAISTALFPLALLALLAASVSATPCPTFSCVPGDYVPGKFTPPYGKTSTLQDLNQEGFYMYSAYLDDPLLTDPYKDCYSTCLEYNLQNPRKQQAVYWQYEDTCEDNGGICYCFGAEACTDGHYNATAHEKEYYSYHTGMLPAANFTVGKLCAGTIQGDPHFTGADGSRFDFSGEPNKVYALVSDAHLQINAFFGGRYGAYNGNPRKALTWMRSVALLFGHHALLLEARAGPSAEYGSGYLGRLALDGEALPLPGVGDRLVLLGGQLEIAQTKAGQKEFSELVDEFEVRVGDAATVRLVLRPEVEELRTEEDGLVHFEVDLVKAQLSSNAHGVIGQTYRPDFSNRLAGVKLRYSSLLHAYVVPGDNAEGFIDGSVADYQCSAIDVSNCKFCRFARATQVDGETARAIEMSSGASYGPRRFLEK